MEIFVQTSFSKELVRVDRTSVDSTLRIYGRIKSGTASKFDLEFYEQSTRMRIILDLISSGF